MNSVHEIKHMERNQISVVILCSNVCLTCNVWGFWTSAGWVWLILWCICNAGNILGIDLIFMRHT